MRLGDRLYECLLRRFARLRKLHAGTEEKSRQKNRVCFSSHPATTEERVHHTSRFLSCARRSPSLTLANNYSQKDSTSCLSFLLAASMRLGNCLRKRSLGASQDLETEMCDWEGKK